jgi:Spherulation-specific family 4
MVKRANRIYDSLYVSLTLKKARKAKLLITRTVNSGGRNGMHFFNSFVIFTVLATRVLEATQVLLPLYSDPSSSEWSSVESTLANYPNVDFILIINPDNGPGSSLSSDWANAVSALKSYSNALVVGYVDTGDTSRSTSEVEDDVSAYAAWPTACRPSGIFFDDVTTDDVSYYSTVAAFVTSQISDATVLLNPGAPASSGYFDFADQVVIYENSYSNYNSEDGATIPGVSASQLSIIIYSVPTSGDTLGNLVSTFLTAGYGSIYLTDADDSYDSLGSDWDTFCTLMSSTNSGGAVGNDDPNPATTTSSYAATSAASIVTPAPDQSSSVSSTPPSTTADATSTVAPVWKHRHHHRH